VCRRFLDMLRLVSTGDTETPETVGWERHSAVWEPSARTKVEVIWEVWVVVVTDSQFLLIVFHMHFAPSSDWVVA
jgi:hypothetical protein